VLIGRPVDWTVATARHASERPAEVYPHERGARGGSEGASSHDQKRSAGSGGPSWTRTRSQWIKNAATANEKPAFSNDFVERIGSEKATERPETTHFGHGVQNEKGVVPMDDVHAAASSLLRRVAGGGEIPLEAVREFAELVLCSELVAGSRQVLDGPPELAVRRAG